MPRSVLTDYTITGEGPAVFLIHGVGSRRSVWEKVVRHLAQHFCCIAYDLRGHAGSAPADMGHSLGGMIIPAYAAAHSSHIKSVGLISTVAFRGDEAKASMANFVKKVDDDGTSWWRCYLIGGSRTNFVAGTQTSLQPAKRRCSI